MSNRDSFSVARRRFLKLGTAAVAGTAFAKTPTMAGPFESTNDYLRLIPEDKKLDPAWLESLFVRGEKDVYSHAGALSHIGMPVGGLFAGTVYLSGDGRLWLWDIFNRDQEGIDPRPIMFKGKPIRARDGMNYVNPAKPNAPFEQGFSLRIGKQVLSLDQNGFPDVTFCGEYPRARITFGGEKIPASVQLEAFSPFIPLNAGDSSLPATVMSYTVKNESTEPLEVELFGSLQNPVCLQTGHTATGLRRNRVVRRNTMAAVECSAIRAEPGESTTKRPDILFDDFEKQTYEGWEVAGTAFGDGPVKIAQIPDYQGDVGGAGKNVVNSHASAPGADVNQKDSQTGSLTSEPFTIERKFITMRIGGGGHENRTCVNLLVDGTTVTTVTGDNNNKMSRKSIDVAAWEGQTATLQIVDNESGPWGNIGIDDIVLSDTPVEEGGELENRRDFGTMALSLMGRGDNMVASADANTSVESTEEKANKPSVATSPITAHLEGRVGGTVTLAPGQEAEFTFVITWHFPNFRGRGVGNELVGHHYASRFESAIDVAAYIAGNLDRLVGETRRWVDTWYDSTLPYWLLDRTMANTSILATTTCYRFKDGRFWAWEGIGCCEGTCTHVWHYAQAPGRLFPEIERDTRERVDFGIAFHEDGSIGQRAGLTAANHVADDGHCGRILGVYREHQMSTDPTFLENLWPKVKRAVEYMIGRDGNDDGMLEDAQANTLDAHWFGKVSFLASLYLAALKAGEAMATEMGDDMFAERCRKIAERGAETILELHNGEYFIQLEDPRHDDKIGVGPGCYIDQIFGQTWAHWVGLGRLFDEQKQVNALRALYRYNFVPDVGPFREHFQPGRWYATAGDAGLLMCTWPKQPQNPKFAGHWQYMYFNECMSGFESQAAAHMIWEGLLEEGLSISRAIHDRYNAAMRNPYNEIECSDHYSRSMASYGVFQAVCGFEHHGPKGHIGFAPRLTPERFKCAFTAAGAWGSFEQSIDDHQINAVLTVNWGELKLKSVRLQVAEQRRIGKATVMLGDEVILASVDQQGDRVLLEFEELRARESDEPLRITLS